MSDTETLVTETENTTSQPSKAVSTGAIQRVELPLNNGQVIEGNTPNTIVREIDHSVKETNDQGAVQSTDVKVEYTDDQRKAFLKEMFGDENVDVEAIKEKLKPATQEPTEAQKQKAASDKELRLMKIFVEKFNGTPEMYNLQKQIAGVDAKEFSKAEAIAEAIAAGFTEEEGKAIANERYYQNKIDALEQDFDNDETDEAFEARKASLQKKIDFGNKKLEAKSQYKIQQAKDFLTTLQKEAESEDLQRQADEQISSNVDEVLKAMPRKQTLELGKSNDIDLAPITHEVSEDSVEKVRSILKDPEQRNNFFNNQDGSLNLAKLTDVLLKSEEYNRIAKFALVEGEHRATQIFQSRFPATTAYELGVGGSMPKNNGNGKVVTVGKQQRAQPQHN